VKLQTFGIYVYRVDPDGKINSLKAYWEFDRAMGTVTPGNPAS
jgi:hypothetical protein